MKKLLNILLVLSFAACLTELSYSQQTKTATEYDRIKARIESGVQKAPALKKNSSSILPDKNNESTRLD